MPNVLAARVVQGLAGGPTALRGAIGQEVAVATGADVRTAHHELSDPLGVGDGGHHRRLPALRVADPVGPLDAESIEQGDRGARLGGNLEAAPLENGEVQAKAAFLVYCSHLETDHQLLSGCREDVLRKVKGAWEVARRTIVLDANVLLDKNLSVFLFSVFL